MQKLNFIDEILFSSDSHRYLNFAKKYGLKNLSQRPKKYSQDNSKSFDTLKYEINKFEKKIKKKFEIILLLQPTSPFRNKKDFIKGYKLISKKKIDSVVSIKKVNNCHPSRMKIIKKGQLISYSNSKNEFKPLKNLPIIYIKSGSMYYFKRNNLIKYKSILGKKTFGIIVENKYAINIDFKEDLVLTEHYFKKTKY